MIDLTPELNMVRDFHAAFSHPIGATPAALSLDRRLTRTRWILSELNEFALAVNMSDELDAAVGMSDAHADALYFVLGSAVEMGETSFSVSPSAEMVAEMVRIAETAFLAQIEYHLTAFLVQPRHSIQLVRLQAIATLLIADHQSRFNTPIQEIFPFVHEANMAKLWPDGKPRYRELDHKVMKPEGWIPPEARIRAYFFARQSAILNAA